MEDDPWKQQVNPTDLPGVTRLDVLELVRNLAYNAETYNRFKEAERQGNREEYVQRLLIEQGINVPLELLKGFRLPEQKALKKYITDHERSPEVWIGIPLPDDSPYGFFRPAPRPFSPPPQIGA